MKRIFFLVILSVCLSFSAFAQQITVQKNNFVPKETSIYHANEVAAYNSKSGQTLIVWEKVDGQSHTILGRMINKQGNAISGQIVLISPSNAAHPYVAYNPVRNEFMLVCDNNPNVQLLHSDIFIVKLNPNGTPSGEPVAMSTDTISAAMANFFPRIIYNPNNSAYSIIWLREIVNASQSGLGNNGLVGAVLSGTGTLAGDVAVIQKTTIESNQLWGPIPLDVQYHPSSKRLFIVTVQIASGTSGGQANYFLSNVDGAFKNITPANTSKINANPIILSASFAWGSKMALFANTSGFLVYVDSGNIKRRKIDATGKLSGGSIVAFKPPKNNAKLFYPALAFSKNSLGTRGVLIALQDVFSASGAATLWVQALDATGVPIGTPVKVDTTTSTDTALTGIVSALPMPPTATNFRFSAFYTLAQFTSPGQTFQNSGIVKLNVNLVFPK